MDPQRDEIERIRLRYERLVQEEYDHQDLAILTAALVERSAYFLLSDREREGCINPFTNER